MANKTISATFFLVLFLVATFEMATVEGQLCEKPSQTWSGFCGNTGSCDDQCKNWEGAAHGGCQWRGISEMCYCYYLSCPTAQQQKQLINEAAKKTHAAAQAAAAAKSQTKN